MIQDARYACMPVPTAGLLDAACVLVFVQDSLLGLHASAGRG